MIKDKQPLDFETKIQIEVLEKQNDYFKKQIFSMNETINELQIIDKTDTQRLDWLETNLQDSTTNFLYDFRDNQFKFTLREFIDKQIIKENETTNK